MKILVTTGTASEYCFVRLLRIIDEFCEMKLINKDELIVQADSNEYRAKNYQSTKMFDNKEFLRIMQEMDLVISHAGTGTVVSALKLNKKLILFPRMQCYGEHIDDHQIELASILKNENYVMVAMNKEELKKCILHSKYFMSKPFVSNTDKFIKIFLKSIEELI